ncbi:hypothetical protein RUND412_009894 [Rhizina undulata]
MSPSPAAVDFLILGAGWTSTYLIPELTANNITFASTNRSGTTGSLPFTFDPDSSDPTPFTILPSAKTVLITFPIRGPGGSETILRLYSETHGDVNPNFIQLGSTGIWGKQGGYNDRHSPIDTSDARGIAESELLALGGCVLNLSGLWGHSRDPKNWVRRVAPTRDAIAQKTSLHLIHGLDVARAIVAVHRDFTPGERWMLTDLRVYDWWDLAAAWGAGGEDGDRGNQAEWVMELMQEWDVRSLPRPVEMLGRALDGCEFWRRFRLMPKMALAT